MSKPAAPSLSLWYRQQAEAWIEALPVGNGRQGAMVFGRTDDERIQLNENTLWEGHPQENANPEAAKYVAEVRRLLFAGKNEEAAALAAAHMMGVPSKLTPYQSLGDLTITRLDCDHSVTDYRRDLDLDTGIAASRFRAGENTYTREVFASYPDQVIAIRLGCDNPAQIHVRLSLQREQDARCERGDKNSLLLRGQMADPRGLHFQALLSAIPVGGTTEYEGDTLVVREADSLVILIAAGTSYRGNDPTEQCRQHIARACSKTFDALRQVHIADHQRLYRRVELDLGGNSPDHLPTDERLVSLQAGDQDNGLTALFFQYGRYLLIASSRSGGLPANLQGLWNDSMNPPWNSDYHLNINLQMNYWHAESTNLSECHRPLLDYIQSLVDPGSRTARLHYNCCGWVVHHISDIWGFTAPADGVLGIWPMGSGWLAQHCWEHFLFTRDSAYLQESGYPVMREAARFYLDFLVSGPNGKLVTSPSHSPENRFKTDDGVESMFTYGATMDLEIIHNLFTACIEAGKLLHVDPELCARLKEAIDNLAPLQVAPKSGRLQEWIEDYDEPEPGHRHISHLFALHPGNQITVRAAPELAAAAQKSLEYRLAHGGGHTGWSRAWIINFWARLENGREASKHLQYLLSESTASNLFDLHPPFQIDGNFGGTAGIAEMLLQSHAREVSLLPALPAEWGNGSVSGLRARGGVTVRMKRRDGKLTDTSLQIAKAGACRVRVPAGQRITSVFLNKRLIPMQETEGGSVVEFAPEANRTYYLMFGD